MDEPLPACRVGYYTHLTGDNNGIKVGDNQDRDCLSIYQEDPCFPGGDSIHICDWPAFKAAVDAHQRGRGGKI